MQTLTITRLTLREVLRRRSALLTLIALPLAFYLARHELPGQSIRMLALGLGWAVATLALFVTVGSLGLDRRLCVAGYRPATLLTGRFLALTTVGLVLGAAYLVLVAVDQSVDRVGGVGLMLACAVVTGVPLGIVVGLLLRRELEGALGLLIVLATQMIANPDGDLAKGLPMWSVRQLATYSIDAADSSYLSSGLLHAGGTTVLLLLVAAVLSAVRLRRIRPDRVLPVDEAVSATR